MADQLRFGDAVVTRVVEWQVDDLPMTVFPQTPADAWRDTADFTPTYWNDEGWRIALQICSWSTTG
jgi:hypothetical protein